MPNTALTFLRVPRANREIFRVPREHTREYFGSRCWKDNSTKPL